MTISLIDQIVPQREFYEAYGIVDSQLCNEILAVCFDGADTEEKLIGDLRIAVFLADKPQDFQFATGQYLIDLFVFDGNGIPEIFVPVADVDVFAEEAAPTLYRSKGS